MSTAGKVLVVLIVLVMPIWVFLAASVAQLNKNGGERVAALEADVARLEKEVAEMKLKSMASRDQVAITQVAMLEQLSAIRSRQAALQSQLSSTTEIASAAKNRVASTLDAFKRAESTRDLRKAEHQEEAQAKAEAEAEVDKLKQEHAELAERLETLRTQFKSTVDSNRKQVERLKSTRSS
jgi:chromosome segregation ATPase